MSIPNKSNTENEDNNSKNNKMNHKNNRPFSNMREVQNLQSQPRKREFCTNKQVTIKKNRRLNSNSSPNIQKLSNKKKNVISAIKSKQTFSNLKNSKQKKDNHANCTPGASYTKILNSVEKEKIFRNSNLSKTKETSNLRVFNKNKKEEMKFIIKKNLKPQFQKENSTKIANDNYEDFDDDDDDDGDEDEEEDTMSKNDIDNKNNIIQEINNQQTFPDSQQHPKILLPNPNSMISPTRSKSKIVAESETEIDSETETETETDSDSDSDSDSYSDSDPEFESINKSLQINRQFNNHDPNPNQTMCRPEKQNLSDLYLKLIQDPNFYSEYGNDYINSLLNTKNHYPEVDYIKKKQIYVNNEMRTLLIRWLNEVCHEYELQPETFYLAINYLDRFLSKMKIYRRHIQLVGVTSLLIASKFEEIRPPAVNDFSYITKNTYSEALILQCEIQIINVLKFRFRVLTPIPFLKFFLFLTKANKKTKLLAYYISELQVPHIYFLKFKPEVIALSSIAIANLILNKFGKDDWNNMLTNFPQFHLTNLIPCILKLTQLYKNISKLKNCPIFEKFNQDNFLNVSSIPIRTIIFENK
ncbi:cyclin-a1-1 [Anaeramoeba flamelloides]|uniref:Cyclin-a1-1 n=1 Tax=Anaeramoeba flamelloides TaxID=1746091 RepID=A0AAV7YJ43_9EUKA|nr:cyclin-a1-1 [Anaeramoeba flamelloides]